MTRVYVETEIDLEDYYDEIPDHDIQSLYDDRFGHGVDIPEHVTRNDVFVKLLELGENSPLWFSSLMDDIAKLESFKKFTV